MPRPKIPRVVSEEELKFGPTLAKESLLQEPIVNRLFFRTCVIAVLLPLVQVAADPPPRVRTQLTASSIPSTPYDEAANAGADVARSENGNAGGELLTELHRSG